LTISRQRPGQTNPKQATKANKAEPYKLKVIDNNTKMQQYQFTNGSARGAFGSDAGTTLSF
jgi:hypothetical protein